MLPVLEIDLLGNFQLRFAGQSIDKVNTPRLQSLLAYLLLHRQTPISRQQLSSLFWPDTSEAQSRTNLRNLIHYLRRALPHSEDFLQSDPHFLEWRKEAPFSLDVNEFEHCLSAVPGKSVPAEALERAAQIYRGDLLPDCYDDWIQPERERLRSAFHFALEALAVMSEDAREYPTALKHTRRLVQADPFHPRANQRLIRLHCLLGDRPAALKTYRDYAHRMQHELGMEPDAEIQALYDRVRQVSVEAPGDITKGLDTREGTPSERHTRSTPRDSSPMVGRMTEWHLLKEAWQTTPTTSARMIFISGEAGIGKTRLVEELTSWAARQGIETAAAFCYPAEGSLPYAPVVSWLRSRPLPALEKTWLGAIAHLLPEVQQKNSGQFKSEPLRESWQRQHLFEALTRALLARRQPQILVLEDIHWCDQDTLEWLHYLLRFNPKAPLLIVATVRSGEIMPDSLAALQTSLQVEGKCSELELHPLSEPETRQLANQINSEPFSAEAGARIYQESEGNPLFIVESVRLGQILPGGTPKPEGPLATPERVQAVLSHRIGQLSPGTREITCLAAAIGREFSLDVLSQASGEKDEHLVKAVDELLQRHIIQEISPETYDFTHDRLRQTAFKGLSTAHRRLLHRRVAEAYLSLDKYSLITRDAEIASHYEQAGLGLQAVHHYQLAAESAARSFANFEAQRHLQRAVELAGALPIGGQNGLSPQDFAMLLERLGDILMLNGLFPPAQSAFERVLVQPFSSNGIWHSQIHRKISDTLIPQYQHDQAQAALDQAEQALNLGDEGGTLAGRQEWIQIQLARSQLFYWKNDPDQMDAIIQKIAQIVEREGRVDQQINLLSQQLQARARHERYRLSAETVTIGWRRLELAETLPDPFELALAQFQLGFALLWYGDPTAARDWLIKGTEAMARVGARIWQIRGLAYLSIANRKLNDLETLPEQIRRLLELSAAIDEPTYHGMGLANQGWLAWREGNAAQAEQLCKAAREDWRKFGGNVFHWLADWVLLAIAVSQGDLAQAESYAQALLDPNPLYQPAPKPAADLLGQACAACQKGDAEGAIALFNRALAEARIATEL